MDIVAPLMIDPAAPRLTTYTSAGRMELSGLTLGNWQAKVAHLLRELGLVPGDEVGIIATPGWQPAVIAMGAWHVGAVIVDDPDAQLLFTDSLSQAEDSQADEVFLLSTDPFGRGVEEAGGEVPFGINDFSPIVRVQSDQYHFATVDGPDLAPGVPLPSPNGRAERVVAGPWTDARSLAETLAPLWSGGSVVMSIDTSAERLKALIALEKADAIR